MGHVRVDPLSAKAINYVAGYCAKKIGYDSAVSAERVDPETGEVYRYQKPFLQMSRKPGIASNARQFTQSWKDFAINDGNKQAVPRYLHESYLSTLNEEQLANFKKERQQRAVELQRNGPARERELEAKHKQKTQGRTL